MIGFSNNTCKKLLVNGQLATTHKNEIKRLVAISDEITSVILDKTTKELKVFIGTNGIFISFSGITVSNLSQLKSKIVHALKKAGNIYV